ncbi:MAG: S1 RNA-binding domain-containing protein [Patescibacteria group bacterium]|nr:S1 RNA-binding domain-containing protein [Patescibacteria group bacterium]MCL5224100.1 S1 RNA-binding domain-containing protein [Patescibacteria group bacterium]
MTAQKQESALASRLKDSPDLMPILKTGDLVGVKLMEKTGRTAYFEIPRIGTGMIYGVELLNAKDVLKRLSPGDTVSARVVDPENDQGYVELSLAEAGKQRAWQEIQDLQDKDEPLKVKITDANAGGLITELSGITAFIPASQLSNDHYPKETEGDRNKMIGALKKFVDQELTVKILNINPRSNKLILSEREVENINIKELLAKYKPGDVISGIISGVASFGAFLHFADEPLIEGLIHISELDHRLIDNPKEVVKVGDLVQAKIVDIKDGRVSLSLKALKSDPWEKVEEKYKAGDVVDGRVHRFNAFGAFIELDPSIVGLIHVSEFGSIEELRHQLEEGKTYKFVIESVRPKDKRIVLKLAAKAASAD